MAYVPNYLSGKFGGVFLYNGPTLEITETGGITGGYEIPLGSSVLPPGGYTTTWAFGKWKIDIETTVPKVTNFTAAATFYNPVGMVTGVTNITNQTASSNVSLNAFQQLVQGVTKGTITVEGPYDLGNMPLVSGYEYTFALAVNSALYIYANAFITKLSPSDDIEDAARITVTAESNGYFWPCVA
jgi:hypothetical protein